YHRRPYKSLITEKLSQTPKKSNSKARICYGTIPVLSAASVYYTILSVIPLTAAMHHSLRSLRIPKNQ
ncbi:hypothetical protein, partial [Enterocloster bolteae]|uniref:hypothetical protein n=1 Tax=Enterocloster bolteae TaxID=208479 RepID=UPI002A82FE3A